MFWDQIGNTNKVYIDNVVVKSLENEDHINHLEKPSFMILAWNLTR